MQDVVRRHDALMQTAIAAHDGYVFKTIGDAFCAAFARPEEAVAAILDAQRALGAEDFSAVDGLRVRAAVHTGTADEREGDYFGPAVNRIARLLAIGAWRSGARLGCHNRSGAGSASTRGEPARSRRASAPRPRPTRTGLPVGRGRSRCRLPAAALARRPSEQLATAAEVVCRPRNGDRRNHSAHRAASTRHAGRFGRRWQDAHLLASRSEYARRLWRRRVVHRTRTARERRIHSIGCRAGTRVSRSRATAIAWRTSFANSRKSTRCSSSTTASIWSSPPRE